MMNVEPSRDIVAVQNMTNFIPVDCPSVNVEIAPEHSVLPCISVWMTIVIIKHTRADVEAIMTPFHALHVFSNVDSSGS